MGNFYVDSTVPGPGSGTLLDPWDDLASNVNSQGNGPHTFHLRGGVVAQLYNEAETTITVDDIIVQPYQAELVEIRAPGVGDYIFVLQGDSITINGKNQLDLNKNNATGACVFIEEGADDCTVQDCEIRNARWFGAMTRVEGDRATISGCTIHNIYNGNASDGNGITFRKGEDLTVTGCTIYDCYGDGIQIDDAHTPGPWYIRDCIIYTTLANCSENAIDAKINGDSSVQSEITGCTFYGFRACDSTCGGSGDPAGAAVRIHNSCDNVLMEECLIYDCTSGVFIDDGALDVIMRLCVIRDLLDSVADPIAANLDALLIRATNVEIYNCTFDDCPEDVIHFIAPINNVVIENCIFNDTNTITGDGLAGWSADYNCWFGYVDRLVGAHDVTTDPTFVNEAGNDFHLQAGSDCIDAGINKGLPYYGSAPDIGRYEYQPPGAGTVYVVIVVTVNTVVVLQSP